MYYCRGTHILGLHQGEGIAAAGVTIEGVEDGFGGERELVSNGVWEGKRSEEYIILDIDKYVHHNELWGFSPRTKKWGCAGNL